MGSRLPSMSIGTELDSPKRYDLPQNSHFGVRQSHFKDNGGLYAPHNHLSRPNVGASRTITQQTDFLAVKRGTGAAQPYGGGAESNKQEMNVEKSDIFMREA